MGHSARGNNIRHGRERVYRQCCRPSIHLGLQAAQALRGCLQLLGLVLLILGPARRQRANIGLAFLQLALARCQLADARLQIDVFLLEPCLHLRHGLLLRLDLTLCLT